MSHKRTITQLSEFFEAINGLKILIIGDVMLDTYVWGKVKRISPEAPVPVVQVLRREDRLGGAGNVALNVRNLGAKPILVSVVGDDSSGESFQHILKDNEITESGIIRSKERATTRKERVMAGSQHLLRVDTETIRPLSELEEKSLISHIKSLITECDAVIFEDYDKGTLNPHVIEESIRFAKEAGVPTIVDPKKDNFFAYKNVDLFKPNLKELQEGLKMEFEHTDKEALQDAVNQLKKKLKAKTVICTLSEAGIFVDSQKEQHFIAAHKRDISDVSGAGDTVVSIAAIATALGMSPYFTAAIANLGGGLVCEQLGVVPIDKEKLMAEAERCHLRPS
jgi:D-glycero-beta-D-manno-heptose-7-phosphate kinase